KGGGRRAEAERIYAHPLPLLFEPHASTSTSLVGLLGLPIKRVVNPRCTGIFELATRSVWVTDARDARVLWTRGFFGKGNLSRSEPSWKARQENARKAARAGKMTSEEVTAQRRAERQQFKQDRARALAEVAAAAEATFTATGAVMSAEEQKANVPSAATWKKPQTEQAAKQVGQEGRRDGDEDKDWDDIEDLEHLQLTLSEAFFLAWALDCLTVLHPDTLEPMTLSDMWSAFQNVYLPLGGDVVPPESLRTDNPFILHYVFYHHYRSLGWVVKTGIKFCVDYLLYKRGPVFHHAEFAMVLVPAYEDENERRTSPFDLAGAEPSSWVWLSTLNRVNSQVMKTLVLAYVTIPSAERLAAGRASIGSPGAIGMYSVREVTVRRFIPARMRD
ncbi:hypothetical protein K488DRAFT_21651, partial [Vararia minispora EC-137]